MRSILDPAFRYVPSFATSVAATWRRFGWRPTTDEERKTRRRRDMELVVEWVEAANVLSPSAPLVPAQLRLSVPSDANQASNLGNQSAHQLLS